MLGALVAYAFLVQGLALVLSPSHIALAFSLLHAHTFDFPKWNATSFQIGPIRAANAGNDAEAEEEDAQGGGTTFFYALMAYHEGAWFVLVLGYCSL